MLMRTSTHHKMVEADTVKIAEQGRLIRKLQAQVQELKTRNMDLWATKDDAVERAQKVFAANLKLAAELQDVKRRHAITEIDACNQASRASDLLNQIDRLNAKLLAFTAPPRGAGGRFVSGKQERAA